MRMSALVALGAVLIVAVSAAPKSRFNRDIDDKKLEEEWADPESEEWHEDTFEWKRKMAQKRAKPLDMEELTKAAGSPKLKDTVLQHEASSGNVQMAFATVKKSVTEDAKEIEKIGQRWQGLLATAGVHTSLYPIGGQDLLMTEDNTRILQVRDFLLTQPELEKFRWKDTDFFPTPTPAPTTAKVEKKKKSKAAKADKEKRDEL